MRQSLAEREPDARELLDRSASLLNEAEQFMSDIVWAVSPQHDTLESLFSRIHRQTADTCRAKRIAFRVEADAPDGRAIPGTVRRGVFLVYKEALRNAVRHAGASSIAVRAGLADGVLSLEVTDDGRGIAPGGSTSAGGGQGLGNMRVRAEEIGGTLEVAPAEGGGTRVSLAVKIAQEGH